MAMHLDRQVSALHMAIFVAPDWLGEEFHLSDSQCREVQSHGVSDGYAGARLGVQAAADFRPLQLQMVSDVPFQDDACMPRDHPAMHVLAAAVLLLGKKITGDIAGLEPGRAQGGDQVGVDVDARTLGQAASEKRDVVCSVVELDLGMALGELAGDIVDDCRDRTVTVLGAIRNPARIAHQGVGGAGKAIGAMLKQQLRVGGATVQVGVAKRHRATRLRRDQRRHLASMDFTDQDEVRAFDGEA